MLLYRRPSRFFSLLVLSSEPPAGLYFSWYPCRTVTTSWWPNCTASSSGVFPHLGRERKTRVGLREQGGDGAGGPDSPVLGYRIHLAGLQQEADHLQVPWKQKERLSAWFCWVVKPGEFWSGLTFSCGDMQGRPGVVVSLLHVHGGQRKPGTHTQTLSAGRKRIGTGSIRSRTRLAMG